MAKPFNRRQFMQACGTTLGGMFVAGQMFPRMLYAASGKVVERKDVSKLDPNGPELTSYRNAITEMQKRSQADANDPTGWTAQANIHRNFCPHGNWFFLPWHRAYLYYFEQVCRETSGDPNFALPYWNWTDTPKIPAPFWDGVLNHKRDASPEDVFDAGIVDKPTIDGILGITNFELFASFKATTQRAPAGKGQLEGGPHDSVHGWVGGDMGFVMRSPLDPIFWLHHANLDRLWTEWVIQHPAGTTSDPDWLDFTLGEFYDAASKKNNVTRQVKDLLSTYDLGYRYTTQPEQPVAVTPAGAPALDFAAVPAPLQVKVENPGAVEPGQALSVKLKAPDELHKTLLNLSSPDVKERRPARLTIAGVTPPQDNSIGVRVFINCQHPSPKTPVTDPTFLGTFGFFGADHNHGEGAAMVNTPAGATYNFDISGVLRRLKAEGLYPSEGEYKVSLVSAPLRRGPQIPEVKEVIKPSAIRLMAVS